jgi:phosphoenolpyruvate carboxylase
VTPEIPQPAGTTSEKRGDILFLAKDAGLRQDVHDLGMIVGELLEEQGGKALLDRVEQTRRAAIDAREGDPEAGQRLAALLGPLSAIEAETFIRAFSTYFQAVNSAELVHRIRRRRAYLREGKHRQPGGFEDTLFELRDMGVTPEGIAAVLADLKFEPVLTAHPTEPTRRTILRRQNDIVRRLIDMQNPSLSPRETAADLENIRDDITAIWQTDEHPPGVRTVADELEHVLFFLTETIYRVIPVLYESFETALETVWGKDARSIKLPVMVRLASWIGGDMVGRNEITARTIRELISRQRSLILDLYHRECRDLTERLSQSRTRIGVSAGLEERIRLYTGHFPNALSMTPVRHREMRYRVMLRLMMARLQSTFSDGIFPYDSAEELANDLRLVIDSLTTHGGQHAGLFAVRRLLRRVETFGFHFMTLDIRQEAVINRRIIGRSLDEADWLQQSAAYRTERLRKALAANESPLVEFDNEGKRAIGVFQAIAFCRRRFGEKSIGPYIISMAEGVDDVLSVLLLAQWSERLRREDAIALDIAPAFETIGGLGNAAALIDQLCAEPAYREHLAARDRHQVVMLGVSDSNVDTDLVSARWALLKAQRELLTAAADRGIELTMFHGRGGALGAGGGKAHADILSAPPGAVQGGVRAIEQGELVANKYGVRAIALRTLDQALAAVTRSKLRPGEPRAGERPDWEAIIEVIVAAARGHYQALVMESPGFSEYYRLATPADVIERMRHGSDPESGLSDGLLAAAGTAPWVFAWTQSRNILSGWYGIGCGLERALEQFGAAPLQEMLAGWYFFRTLISDVETALAKSDLTIASQYSALGGELHERFFPRIHGEFLRSTATVLRIKQQQVLLEKDNTLRRSIRLRNPYVDPMSLLQIDLLRRWRQSNDEVLFNALTASVNGIARGLQDSG